jgi:SulP family sulfate permease
MELGLQEGPGLSGSIKPKLLTTIVGYTAPQFAADAIAASPLPWWLCPLSIAIAIASGAPPAAGLITAVVAGFLISALGGSRVQIGGPTGAFIVVVYGVIASTDMTGCWLARYGRRHSRRCGRARAGRLIRHIPNPSSRASRSASPSYRD